MPTTDDHVFVKVFRKAKGAEDKAFAFLQRIGIINHGAACKCSRPMTLYWPNDVDKPTWRCFKYACKVKQSVQTNTILENCKLPFTMVLELLEGWIQKRKARALHESTLLAQNTINLFNRSLRELCHAHMLRLERTQIGGEGMIVEIDEMKLSKRKYNRGRQVGPTVVQDGVPFQPDLWAFGT